VSRQTSASSVEEDAAVQADTRQADFDEAAYLAAIPALELAEMTGGDLDALLQRLNEFTHKMQEQAAAWLDAREQLQYVVLAGEL
jgi:hypothetical protein